MNLYHVTCGQTWVIYAGNPITAVFRGMNAERRRLKELRKSNKRVRPFNLREYITIFCELKQKNVVVPKPEEKGDE